MGRGAPDCSADAELRPKRGIAVTAADRLRAYVGARLQRRLFVWFALTVLATAAIAAGAVWLAVRVTNPDGPRGFERIRFEYHRRLIAAWHQPGERRRVAEQLHAEHGFDLELQTANGARLDTIGGPCSRGRRQFPLIRGDRVVGLVEVCVPSGPPPRFWWGLAVGMVALWAFCGLAARRLARPLVEVARVAEQIGSGQLDVAIQPVSRFAHSRDEVTVVGEVLQEMAQRISHQLRDQRELLAAVSHELRTPLGHLRLLLETHRQRTPSAERDAVFADRDAVFAGQVVRELRDMDELVGQLLANARLEFRQMQRQVVSLTQLCVQTLERMGLEPTLLDVEGGHLSVLGDPTLLQRALANMLDNAQKHGGGATAVRLRAPSGLVVVEVQDAGAGFADGQQAQAFQPFYSAGHRAESLGLGLHLVEKIVVAHGGRVFARNAQTTAPCGAIVGFELPLAAVTG